MLEFIDNSKFIDSVLLILAGFMIGQEVTMFMLKQKNIKQIAKIKKVVTIKDLELSSSNKLINS